MKKLLARTALAAFTADLALKMVPLGEARVLVFGVLGLKEARNSGVAFSLLDGHPGLSLAVGMIVFVLGLYLLRGITLGRLEALGAGLMLGGALGNLVDRLLHGAVKDYLEFLFIRFPVFNLADACLTLGAVLLALGMVFGGKEGLFGHPS